MAASAMVIVLVSGSEASQAVVAQLREWSELGLLDPTVIVPLQSTSGLPGPAPRILCRETLSGLEDELLRLLAGQSFGRVGLLSLFDVEAERFGRSQDFDPYQRSLDIIHEVQRAMPLSADATRAGSVTLTSLRLLAPTSDGEPFPAEWGRYQSAWEYSLLIAPEDRRSPDSPADHVRWPGNYAHHVAGALAGVAGMWRGLSGPTLLPDQAGERASGADRDAVRVLRAQNRVAGVNIPMGQISRHVLEIAQGARPYPDGTDVKLRPVGGYSAEKLLNHALEALLGDDTGTLRYRPVPPPEEREKKGIQRADALQTLAGFTFGPKSSERGRTGDASPRRGPHFPGGALGEPWHALRSWFTRRVDEVVTDVALGADAEAEVITPLATQLSREWTRQWEQIREEESRRPRVDPPPDYSAGFWAVLRAWVLGLVDGERPDLDPELMSVIDIVRDRARITPVPIELPLSDIAEHVVAADAAMSPFDAWTATAAVGLMARTAHQIDGSLPSQLDHPESLPDGIEQFAATDVLVQADVDLQRVDQDRAAAAASLSKPRRQKRTRGRRLGAIGQALLSVIALVVAALLWWQGERFPAVVLMIMFLPLLVSSIATLVRNGSVPGRVSTSISEPLGKEFAASHPLAQRASGFEDPAEAPAGAAQILASDAGRLESWLARYRGTLLGKLSHSAGASADGAARDLRNAMIEYEGLAWLDTSELRRRRESWFFWFWFAPLMFVGGVSLILWWLLTKAGPTVTIPGVAVMDSRVLTAATLALWTVLSGFLFIHALLAYHRAYRSAEAQAARWGAQARNLSDRMTHARSEAHRLRMTNVQFGRWAEVLSWIVRNPYGRWATGGLEPQPGGDGHASAAAGTGSRDGQDFDTEDGLGEDPPLHADEPEATAQPTDPVQAPAEPRPIAHNQNVSGLSTMVGRIVLDGEFEEGELRRAVEVGCDVGWLTAVFYELAGYAFENLQISGSDAVLRMDRDGSEQQSVLVLFLTELRLGGCQQRAAEVLVDRLVNNRAELGAAGGRSALALQVETERGSTVVEQFLAEIEPAGTTMRRTLYRDSAIVGRQHSLEEGVLWTHSPQHRSHGQLPPPGLRVVYEEVVPDEHRIQLAAVRIDATGLVDINDLVCFTPLAEPAERQPNPWAHSKDLV